MSDCAPPCLMSFRLWTIFYVFALVAAAMATFGPWGIVVAGIVLIFWVRMFYASNPRVAFFEILIAVSIIGLLVALLLPAVASSRGISRRNQCLNNMAQIGRALQEYYYTHRTLPPPYIADAEGKPMHSWRVLLLPYLEEDSLFEKYNFNEPWNGPNNRKLAGQMPAVYRCPSDFDEPGRSSESSYYVVADPKTAFPPGGLSMKSITDGTSKTIMAIEDSGLQRNWLDPRALSLDEAVKLLTASPRSGHRKIDDGFLTKTYSVHSGRVVAYCDGRSDYIGQLKDAAVARSLLTVAGGESIPADLGVTDDVFITATVIKWGKVWALSLFIILTLLPAIWIKRRVPHTPGDA